MKITRKIKKIIVLIYILIKLKLLKNKIKKIEYLNLNNITQIIEFNMIIKIRIK